MASILKARSWLVKLMLKTSKSILVDLVDPKLRAAGVEIFPSRGAVGFRADTPSIRRRASMASVNFGLSSADLKIPVVVNSAFGAMAGALFGNQLGAKDRTCHCIIIMQNTAFIRCTGGKPPNITNLTSQRDSLNLSRRLSEKL
jgi:hypothetical protein